MELPLKACYTPHELQLLPDELFPKMLLLHKVNMVSAHSYGNSTSSAKNLTGLGCRRQDQAFLVLLPQDRQHNVVSSSKTFSSWPGSTLEQSESS